MALHCLSKEASEIRVNAMILRIASEATIDKMGIESWKPESDYWKLNRKLRKQASDKAREILNLR